MTRSVGHSSPDLHDASPDALEMLLARRIAESGGWMRFDEFMRAALYEPELGYYTGPQRKFGRLPADGSDFVTAPELSGLFGRALARQVGQVLDASAPHVLEFGAGSGRLAADLLVALGDRCASYTIIELSGRLSGIQRATLQHAAPDHLHKVRWADTWPARFSGCAVGNEVLDAMPVRLIEKGPSGWLERGVVDASAEQDAPSLTRSPTLSQTRSPEAGARQPTSRFAFATRPASASLSSLADARVPAAQTLAVGYRTELAEQSPAMVASLAAVMQAGAALFIDYGFPDREYYHPQRDGGTLMCHQGHLGDTDPLVAVGHKDITAHVDFSAVALAGQDAGFDVLGYTSQARFLLNCGLLDLAQGADWKTLASAQTLIAEHEMGELFKVLAFSKGLDPGSFGPIGFGAGDRMHTL